jgi:hypothetical protein
MRLRDSVCLKQLTDVVEMDKWECRFCVDKPFFHPGQVPAAAAAAAAAAATTIKIEQRQPLININSNRNSWKPKTN